MGNFKKEFATSRYWKKFRIKSGSGARLVDQIEGRRIQHGQPKTVGDALDFRKDYRPEEGRPFKFAYDIDATQYPVITED